MSGGTTFKKRPVADAQVAQAQALAATSGLLADPREAVATVASERPAAANLGSIQDAPTAYEVGNTYDVPLARIKSNPVNPKALYTSASVDEMAISLQENGQRTAAQGYVSGGNVVLIEGETRFRGARTAGIPTLRIEIRPRPESDRHLYETARAANKERRDGSPLDDAIRWADLLERKVYTSQADIAKALKLGEDEVSRTMQLTKLPQRVLISLAEAPELLNGRMLNAIREFHAAALKQDGSTADDATVDLILEVARSGMGYREVVARRKQLETGPVRRARSTAEPVIYGGIKGEIKTFAEGGRMELSFKGLTPDQAESLKDRIKAAFAQP